MTTSEIRKKYIEFFVKHGHKEILASPLVLENDPTTLFTSSGMQQMIPYLKGEKHPLGTRLVNSQLSIRMQDLDEVADNRHLSSFEMLGNWSLGDYFKSDQLPWIWEFITKVIGLDPKHLHVTMFAGNDQVSKDTEAYEIWKKIGLPETHMHFYEAAKNWWSRAGEPNKMPIGEIGGPDSEIFFEFENVSHDPSFGKFCHPNCDCGKFLEIGNSVFMQYKQSLASQGPGKKEELELVELPQKNVDFGGGLERLAAAVNGNPDIFRIDMFAGIIKRVEDEVGIRYGTNFEKDKNFRIIADHLRTSCSLLAEGVLPSNKLHGYALRRLIRRAMFHCHLLGTGISGSGISHIAEDLRSHYPSVDRNWAVVEENLNAEATRFESALKRGLAKLTKAVNDGLSIDGKFAFDLFQNDGFPLELTMEILSQNGMKFDPSEKNSFESEFEKHKENSRSMSAGLFKGGLESKSDETITKLHTATHLLHASLRKVLGSEVHQAGSDITAERLRFDFNFSRKLTPEELQKIEDLTNEAVRKDYKVTKEEMVYEDAIKSGALAFFKLKYPSKVNVYSIGPLTGLGSAAFSRELCGGPHVSHTAEIGHIKITKEEAVSAGVRRIRAVIP